MCPLFRGSIVHKEEDNLSILDKMADPNVSFIQRFHCTQGRGQPLHSGKMAGPKVSFIRRFHCEDNFSIVDKMAGPKVSFIRRFHCT